jgi:U3 small nucleolar RNA-associated protein 20
MKRALLRDWMRVVLGFKSLSNFPESKRLLSSVSAHVMDIDPLVQKTAVKVMNLFKLTWLSPYVDKILRFADNKTLRAELTAFPLAMSATSVRANEDAVLEIEKDHRKDLVPLLIAMLFPRMRKRNGRLGGKGMLVVFPFFFGCLFLKKKHTGVRSGFTPWRCGCCLQGPLVLLGLQY